MNEYEVLGFVDGQILNADEMNHLESGIALNNANLNDLTEEVGDISNSVTQNESNINNILDKLTKYVDADDDGNIVITYEDVTI